MAAKANMAHLLSQPHQNYNQTIEQPSLRTSRNEVEWRSCNHGIKEETTSIQTGRTNGDVEWLVPHPCVEDKDKVGYLRNEVPSPIPGTTSQGSSTRKISPQNFWLQKAVENEPVEETAGFPGSSSLRACT